jgi:hypothetical protein
MTPLNVEALKDTFDLREQTHDWLGALSSQLALSGKSKPEPFSRHRITRTISRFSANGERDNKVLLICFTGISQRMMMPLPVFLQHIDSSTCDVALLMDIHENGYRSGLAGVADTLEESIEALPALLGTNNYQSVIAFGVSGGGLPSVLSALRLEFDAALSVSGNGPDDPRWNLFYGARVRSWLSRRANASSKPRIYIAYGVDSPEDKSAAESLSKILSASLVPISDVNAAVSHNALYSLVQSEKLIDLFDQTIFRKKH